MIYIVQSWFAGSESGNEHVDITSGDSLERWALEPFVRQKFSMLVEIWGLRSENGAYKLCSTKRLLFKPESEIKPILDQNDLFSSF